MRGGGRDQGFVPDNVLRQGRDENTIRVTHEQMAKPFRITVFRKLPDFSAGSYTMTITTQTPVSDVIEKIFSTPYQDPDSATWYTPSSIGTVDARRVLGMLWSFSYGFASYVDRNAPFAEIHKRFVRETPDTQRYGDAILDVLYHELDTTPIEEDDMTVGQCHVCGAIPEELKQCSRCKSVLYCDAQCRDKDWHHGGHKDICSSPEVK